MIINYVDIVKTGYKTVSQKHYILKEIGLNILNIYLVKITISF
jgi:hypothetical protein